MLWKRSAILVRLAVLCRADLLDPLHECVCPLIESGLAGIGNSFGAETLHLLLIHNVESRNAKDALHGIAVELRETLDHDVL